MLLIKYEHYCSDLASGNESNSNQNSQNQFGKRVFLLGQRIGSKLKLEYFARCTFTTFHMKRRA